MSEDKEKATKRLSHAFTVKDLIDQLSHCPSDSPVVFKYPSGDYWHTRLAGGVELVREAYVLWSEYHRSLQFPQERPEDSDIQEGRDELFPVIVLE